jgi:hypothetical protein
MRRCTTRQVAKFLYQRVVVERRGVEQVLLDDVGSFAGFAGEAEGSVGELLFVGAVAAECAGGELLIFVEMHRANVQCASRGRATSGALAYISGVTWARLTAALTARALANPSLAVDLLRVAWRFRHRHWYKRFPFLPLPRKATCDGACTRRMAMRPRFRPRMT